MGQPQLAIKSSAPNIVEGREFWAPWSIALDTTATPNILYVADTANNRVLGFRNAGNFTNGQAADFVIGQIDKQSTLAQTASTGRQSGLNTPGGLAVDRFGNLYVVDTGNNRILRFPKPAALGNDDVRGPDFVIGQSTTATNAGNVVGSPTATSILTSNGNTAARTGLAFDGQGNLWFTDALNHRVLRYPANLIAGGAPNGPSADLVLGQPDFNTATAPPVVAASRISKAVLRNPGAITIDSDGRVYVSDALGRVLAYTGPFTSAKEASRIVGVAISSNGRAVDPTEVTIGQSEGLFMLGNRLGVVDTGYNRLLIYDPYNTWADETAAVISPSAKVVLGQPAFTAVRANRGNPQAAADSLSAPLAAVSNGTDIYIADSGNNRVVVYTTAGNGSAATRVLGQTDFSNFAPNLVEGKELFIYNPGVTDAPQGGGIVIDNASNPPRMYISDTFNNRILGFADARKVRPGDRADLIIGQVDFFKTVPNSPAGTQTPTETGLFRPIGLAVDKNGDLFVADAGNARVVRYPSPFAAVSSDQAVRPNLVLGQSNLTARLTDASPRNMGYPYGVALTVEGHLVVSDFGHNRVLFFRRPSGDFTNGMAAEKVLGQADFFTTTRNSSTTAGMNGPAGVALDTDDRLYVADSANNRVVVFDRVTVAGNNATPAFALSGVSSPQGVWANPRTGELWVSDFRGNRAQRYPRFELLAITTQPDYTLPANGPMSLTQDTSGNLYIAEGLNRIAIYYNGIATQTAGNFLSRPISPGSIAIIYPRALGVSFGTNTQAFTGLPLPKQLADIQVLLNDRPVPLYFVSPGQINLLVSNNAPESGQVEYQVVQVSTGQVLATGLVEAQRYSPALFVSGNQQQGQVAALNEDSTVNSALNRIARGKIIQIFGTGQGRVPNAPEDGTAPSGQTPTGDRPRILVGSDFVDDADVLYSGLAPSLVGVWQINFRVPLKTAPGEAVDVVVQIGSQNTNGAGFLPANARLRTTIAVSQ